MVSCYKGPIILLKKRHEISETFYGNLCNMQFIETSLLHIVSNITMG